MFLQRLRFCQPLQRFHSDLPLSTDPGSLVVPNIATFFDYAVVSGFRYSAARRTSGTANSLAAVHVSETSPLWVGEILDIVSYNVADTIPQQLFAHMRWLRRSNVTFDSTPREEQYVSSLLHCLRVWDSPLNLCSSSTTFRMQLWDYESYLTASDPGPSTIISLADIISPVVRHTVHVKNRRCWITMPLRRPDVSVSDHSSVTSTHQQQNYSRRNVLGRRS